MFSFTSLIFLSNINPNFQQKYDALGRKDLSPQQKCTTAICMLAYSAFVDAVDDYMRIEEFKFIEYLVKFCDNVILVFEDE